MHYVKAENRLHLNKVIISTI